MRLHETLRKAAGLLVELPPETSPQPAGEAGGDLDKLLAELDDKGPASLRQPAKTVFDGGGDQPVATCERVGRLAERPVRHAELGRQGGERLGCLTTEVVAVEVPPAAAVGDEVQPPVGRPFRLDDRLRGATRHLHRRFEAPVVPDPGEKSSRVTTNASSPSSGCPGSVP